MHVVWQSLTRREMVKYSIAAAALTGSAALFPQHALAAVPTRKNIDALSTEELEAYKHAVSLLVQRGKAESRAPTGYAWQAALHNDFERVRPDGSEGACEHRNELFFPWHRAHLAGFEALLRAADPPRTANVAIPYWDWTKPASGVRFPIAFEDRNSPLFHEGRFHELGSRSPPIQWDAEAVRKMVGERDWFLFAGEPWSQGGSFGWVEDGPHNAIHGRIGPTMGNPSTAARDPIYWSFHAYIDLIWARWQRVHTSNSQPQPFSTPDAKIWVEPFIPVVREVAGIGSMPAGFVYEYDYDFSVDSPSAVVAQAGARRLQTLSTPTRDNVAAMTQPLRAEDGRRRLLTMRDVAVFRDLTYQLDAFVHPPGLEIKASQPAERERYRAGSATVWMSGGHAHHPTKVNFDVTDAIAAFSGREFAISVLASLPAGGLVAPANRFSTSAEASSALASGGPLWGSLVLETR